MALLVNRILPPSTIPLTGFLKVHILCSVIKPKSTKLLYPKPDVDNYAKAILDSLNGHLWEDDSQIIELTIQKEWSTKKTGEFIVTVEKWYITSI